MFINPLLSGNNSTDDLNYPGLIFAVIGLILTVNLKIITAYGDGFIVKQIITQRETAFNIAQVSQITIDEDNRSSYEVFFSGSTRSRKSSNRICIRFHSKETGDLTISSGINTSFTKMSRFLREHHPDLVNHREVEPSF